jgi:hypothetical protein
MCLEKNVCLSGVSFRFPDLCIYFDQILNDRRGLTGVVSETWTRVWSRVQTSLFPDHFLCKKDTGIVRKMGSWQQNPDNNWIMKTIGFLYQFGRDNNWILITILSS